MIEVNLPPPDSVAGRIARDEASGDILLLHSGRIGGGKKRVGKSLFWREYHGRHVDVSGRQYAVLATLTDKRCLDHLAAAVREVKRIKSVA